MVHLRRAWPVVAIGAALVGCGGRPAAAYTPDYSAGAYLPIPQNHPITIGIIPICAREPVTVTSIESVNDSHITVTGFAVHLPINYETGDPPISLHDAAALYGNVHLGGPQIVTTPCTLDPHHPEDRGDELLIEIHRTAPHGCVLSWRVHYRDRHGDTGSFVEPYSVGLAAKVDGAQNWCEPPRK